MKRSFEDMMRVGYSSSTLMSGHEVPDAVRWVNLLSALVFTVFCVLMGYPENFGDGLVRFFFFGMIFGPVVFLVTSMLSSMSGGKNAWWVSISCLLVIAFVCGYFLYRSYGLFWV